MRKSILNLPVIGLIIKAKKLVNGYKKIQRLMTLEGEELLEHQLKRLKKIFSYAYENVEMYRNKWDSVGIGPEDLHSLDDIEKFPLTTKEDFRHNWPDGILSKKIRAKDCYIVGTSGSTGSPVKVFLDLEKIFFEGAQALGSISFDSYEDAMNSMFNLRELIQLTKNYKSLNIVVRDREALENLPIKVLPQLEPNFMDSLDPPEDHVEAINRIKPDALFTYPSCLRNICIYVKENKIDIHQPGRISTSGENLEVPIREQIMKVFDKSFLYNAYGATEVGAVATECVEQDGLHLRSWKCFTELVNDFGKAVPIGDHGRVLVTDLYAKATPIIRYDGLGDTAVMKKTKCMCGRHTPLLERIDGRIVDTVIRPDNKIIHPYSLTLALQDVPYLSKFQIRQEEIDLIRVLLVKDKVDGPDPISYDHTSKVGKMILERFNKYTEGLIDVKLETVEDIPRRPGSHKYATVLSLIKQDVEKKELIKEKLVTEEMIK